MRYLGGGIGHLEQFPPADNKDNESTTHNDGDAEVETEDFIAAEDDAGSGNDDNEDEEEGDEDGEEDEDDEEAEESDGAEGDDPDPGESSDEETGNVY